MDLYQAGSGSHATSSTSFTLSPSFNFDAGASWAVLFVAIDNANTGGAAHSSFTVTDTLGNTWTRLQSPLYDPAGASEGVEGAIFYTKQDGGTLLSSSTITVTVGTAAAAKAWSLYQVYSPLGDGYIELGSSGSGTGANGRNPSLESGTVEKSAAGGVVIFGAFVELGSGEIGTAVGNSTTTDKVWSSVVQAGTAGSSGAGMSVITQGGNFSGASGGYGPGTFTWTPDLNVSGDYIASWVTFREKIVLVGAGAVAIGGNSVTLRYSVGYSITAQAGAVSIAAVAANIVANRVTMRPSADSIDGSWTNELGGTDLAGSIDEADAADSDFIQSPANPVAESCRVKLSSPSLGTYQPVEPMVVAYRYRKSGAGGALDLTVRLLQGTTTIASWTETSIGAGFVTRERTLSSGEFASITDFSDLYLEFEGDMA